MVVLIALAPSIIMQFALMSDTRRSPVRGSLGFISFIGPIMIVAVVAFLAISMRGYLVFSTTQESFRDTLLTALARLNLPFEERLSSVRLPTVPAEIHVAAQGWIGTGQLRLVRGGRRELLGDVARAMNSQFNSTRVQTNMVSALLYLIMGLLMGALVVALIAAA